MEQPLGFEIFDAPDGEKAIRPVYKEVVVRPWGKYENVYIGNKYKIKVITVNPGHRLSDQRHRWRDEFWTIVEGAGKMELETEDDKLTFPVYVKDFLDIYKGQWHRITNTEQVPLVFVEVQIGDCFEDDIERREDDYGRTNIVTEKEIEQGFLDYNESEEEKRARNKNFYKMYEEGVNSKPYE
jgi:mannose-6-phosphate isomerase